MDFRELNLIDPLLRAVREEGYTAPTPIQAQTIPHLLNGRDVLGCAQTGTGKTAAFALPILQRLNAQNLPNRKLRALILAPTRELAAQIGDSFAAYGRYLRFKHAVIFGGVGQQPQVDAVRRGLDILIATPGRLLDLINQGHINLSTIEIFVLDEADRMLDMGFIHDVKRVIAALPKRRQNLLYSATMPPDIEALANSFLINPAHVEVTPPATTVERIDQSIYFVEKGQKPDLLEHLLNDPSVRRALVFTRTKHGANKVVKQLLAARIQAAAIHGNKSQSAREQALAGFRSGSIPVLVATDIAARGIDVDGITHVINYDLPNVPETYVHRIGRTARAGADGVAYSFCDLEEREYLRDIEKTIRMRIPVAAENPYMSPMGLPGEVQLRPGHPLYNGQNAPKAQPKVQSKPASARPQDRPGQQQSASNGGGQASQTARPVGNASTTSGQRQSNGSGTSNPQPRAASASNGSSGTPGAPGAGTSSSAARRRRRRNRSRANGASAQTNPQRAPERG